MDPMQQAISEAFGASVTEAVRPLMDEIRVLRGQVNTLVAQQAELLALIDQVKGKGGMAARLLGVG